MGFAGIVGPFSLKVTWMANYLYTNTVLDGSVILSNCPFAIETTFLWSNFKSKHIFGILMTPRKFLKPFGALQVPLKGALKAPEIWGTASTPMFFCYFLSPPTAPDAAALGGAP